MPVRGVTVDLIIIGRIATLQTATGFGWVPAMAIADGRIVANGDATDILPLATASTSVWRLPTNQIVMPSITDAHLHLTAAAAAARQPDLNGTGATEALEIIARAHRERLRTGDRNGWLLGHGWSFDALGTHPNAAMLDDVAPGRPVALWAHDHHSRWLSGEALRLGGLADRPDPDGGRIERDGTGAPSGVLIESAAGLVDAIVPGVGTQQQDAALIAYAQTLASLGVTSVHDPGGLAPDPQMRTGPLRYRSLAAAGRLPLRVAASIREEQLDRAIEIGFRTAQTGHSNDPASHGRYRDGWIKVFSDGALGSRTAALLKPYEADDPIGTAPGGATGMLLHSREEMSSLARTAAAAGIACQIHAIGDAAVRTVLDALERVPRVGPASHRVEHAQLVDPSDTARFGKLGIAASVQPSHLISDADAAHLAWGRRSASAFPIASLIGAGASTPFGTDAPVEPPDPWPGIAAAVTRRGPDWPDSAVFHAEQAISLERAVRAACLDGPRSLGVFDEGHLGIGARADLLVIPADGFSEPVQTARLASIRPLATMLDGQVISQLPDFDP